MPDSVPVTNQLFQLNPAADRRGNCRAQPSVLRLPASGLAGEALKITEMGLAIKSEIEKAREQVQNLE